MERLEYIGAYGIFIKDGKIWMIKKARGPYKGSFDLPGGRIEDGESAEEALEREFTEETGCKVAERTYLGESEYRCEYTNDKGKTKDFRHKGVYFVVSLDCTEIKKDADGLDSLGAEFIDIKTIESIQISPIAKLVILKVCDKKI